MPTMTTAEATVAALIAHGLDTLYALPGVHNDLVDARIAEGERERCRLDELRAVSDDRDDAHAALRYAALPGPLAQLVEQGTLNPKVVGSIPTRPIQVGALPYAGSLTVQSRRRTLTERGRL